mmetsp:Transcript_24542/g.43409  ORF Transcript_24542/g.43409 Transcript_24542/m.43409 type:complete len:152 (-) Transcript_24542:1038-1493(-)
MLNIVLLLVWAYSIITYLKMMGEFSFAVVGFFTREHQAFRWFFVILQCFLMVVNVLFMVDIVSEIYCSETDNCDLDKSTFVMRLLYAQYTIAYTLECMCIILCGLMMQHLGSCSNKLFPRKLNLERYGIQRPKKKNTVYDLFPHPAVYQIA